MDEESRETLLRIKENHSGLTKLYIGNDADDEYEIGSIFISNLGNDFTTLGRCIGKNTHLNKLEVNIQSLANINIPRGFYNGLRRNSTIQTLMLRCIVLGYVGNEILRAYQENSSQLIKLDILRANIQQNEAEHIALTLRSCTNLKHFNLWQCNITDQKLVPIVEALLRGRTSLEKLYLNDNRIGNTGCQALATLLSHPNCNLQVIQISENNIHNEGAIIIANSVANNTKLMDLCMTGNPIDRCVDGNFYICCAIQQVSTASIHQITHCVVYILTIMVQ